MVIEAIQTPKLESRWGEYVRSGTDLGGTNGELVENRRA